MHICRGTLIRSIRQIAMNPRRRTALGNIVLMVVSVAASLTAIEWFLYLIDTPAQFGKYTMAVRELQSGDQAPWVRFDPDVGVKFDTSSMSLVEFERLSARSHNFERLKIVNADGYHDADEFDASSARRSTHRFLFLGDSFTWGASADLGHSFVEVFEQQSKAKFSDTLVWNTGVPGTGTRQHYQVLKRYGVRMQPKHVVLGFYENDFLDNIFPMDRYFVTRSGISISKYELDSKTGESYRLDRRQMIARLKWLVNRQEVGFSNAFRTTRLLKQTIDRFLKSKAVHDDPPLPSRTVKRTMVYLQSIEAFCNQHEWNLTVVVIPQRETVARSGNTRVHRRMLRLSTQLRANVIDPTPLLSVGDYARIPDGHWNDSGHERVGRLLADRLLTGRPQPAASRPHAVSPGAAPRQSASPSR